MKLLVLLFVVLVVFALIGLGRRARRLNAARRRWQLVERSRGGELEVWLIRSREQRLHVGSVPADAVDFEDRLHELRSEAEMRGSALNAGLPPGGA